MERLFGDATVLEDSPGSLALAVIVLFVIALAIILIRRRGRAIAADPALARKKHRNWVLIVLVAFGLIWIIADQVKRRLPQEYRPAAGRATTTQSAAVKATASAEDEKMLKDLLEAKLVESVNYQLNEAYISPLTWAGMNLTEKRNVSRFLAEYCGKKKRTGLNWVDIKSSMTGKALGKYSESWGFKVYE